MTSHRKLFKSCEHRSEMSLLKQSGIQSTAGPGSRCSDGELRSAAKGVKPGPKTTQDGRIQEQRPGHGEQGQKAAATEKDSAGT